MCVNFFYNTADDLKWSSGLLRRFWLRWVPSFGLIVSDSFVKRRTDFPTNATHAMRSGANKTSGYRRLTGLTRLHLPLCIFLVPSFFPPSFLPSTNELRELNWRKRESIVFVNGKDVRILTFSIKRNLGRINEQPEILWKFYLLLSHLLIYERKTRVHLSTDSDCCIRNASFQLVQLISI